MLVIFPKGVYYEGASSTGPKSAECLFSAQTLHLLQKSGNLCYRKDYFPFATNLESCALRPEGNTSFFSLTPTSPRNEAMVKINA
jgi:hypothetical protein